MTGLWARPDEHGSRFRGQTRRLRRADGRNDVSTTLGTTGAPCWPMAGMACSSDSYPLCGRLYCVCGERFFPSSAADSTREYMSVCGCRLRPIDAATIECRVYAQATHLVPSPATGRWHRHAERLLAQLYVRIEVGGTVDDVRFVPRT